MESSVKTFESDPLLLLKERIIKTETLLDKYACLTRKFNDLEKSHSQAVENEKRAKKDAIKFLEKYCKLTKKSNCLMNKIKILEDNIIIKTNELKESQDDYAKLESVLQVYKTERKGHQCLKKDRDFLLTALWKVLKGMEEEPKQYKSKKMTEIFFKRFERELMDLKLEDFRCKKVANVSRLREKEESEFLFSPGSQYVDSVESDFIDTDIAPESVKSSVEKSDENYVLDQNKYNESEHKILDSDHHNVIKTVDVKILETQALHLPDISLGPFICQEFEERADLIPQEKNFLKACVRVPISDNNGFNPCQDREEENNFTSITSLNSSTAEDSISDTEMKSNVEDESECHQNYLFLKDKHFSLESEENLRREELEKEPEKFRKTYCSKKFQSSHNYEVIGKKLFDHSQLTNMSSSDGVKETSNTTGRFKSANIDIFNVSSEAVNLDTDVSIEDIGNIPHRIQYCDRIYDFLTSSGEISYTKEGTFYDKDSYLLFLTENELVNKLREVNFDTEKILIRKLNKTLSVFDIEDSRSSTPACVREEELEHSCLEFSSDNGNTTNFEEVLNRVCQGKEKNGFIENNEILRKTESENQVDEKSQISSSRLKEITTNCNSNRFDDATTKKNSPNSESTQQDKNISDEEVYRVLRGYKRVPLLSPLKEKEPNKRRTPGKTWAKHDICNLSENIKEMGNLKNTESCEEALPNKTSREEEEVVPVLKTDKEKEKKMVDKIIQTDDKVCFEKNITEQQGNGISEIMMFPETWMRKLGKIVWKKSLKKFKNLNNFRKTCKVHSSCLDLMKILMEIINSSRLYLRNRATENVHFINTKTGQSSNNLQCCKRKVSSWYVEDVEDTNAISKNEPPFNYPKVEDCSFITQVPMHYYSKDRLNSSAVKSEETRSLKNRLSCNLSVSNHQIGFGTATRTLDTYGNACEYTGWEHGSDSDIAFRHYHSNGVVNYFEKRCESSADVHGMTKNVENTPRSNFENMREIHGVTSDALENKTDYLEKCVEVKQAEIQSGEAFSKTEQSVIVLRRSSRIRRQNTLLMKEDNRTNEHSLIVEESHNLKKDDFLGSSLPSSGGTSSNSRERYSNKSINDILPIKEITEKTKTSTLKDKYEELFGQSESQSECSSSESGLDLTLTEEQKEETGDLKINTNSYASDAPAIRKKRTFFGSSSKAGRTYNKKIKWELPSICDENSEEGFPASQVPVNGTFSSEDIGADASSNILDSIMTAMTKQSEFFKVQPTLKETEVSDANYRYMLCAPQLSQPIDCNPSASIHPKISNEYRMKGDNSALLNLPYYWNVDNSFGDQAVKEKEGSSKSGVNHREEAKLKFLVQKEIRNFLKMDINTVEEGEEKIKSCIAVLRKASENIIANTIVNEIMANVDEELKEFERPAPPLTQTQHRIMIILTVFSLSNEQFHRISNNILKIIRSKIFPENFFWPDDSLEMVSRFYAALCKRLNNFKGIWKFCFKVLTSMRQRWCIPIFVVLQIWPDIIHNANYVQDNILVNTFVNIILHTPKSEDMRRKRQEQRILAIKHLLINFYNFDVNSTIEGFTQKLWESLVNNTRDSVRALVFICQCRTWSWTRKNVIAKILETMESWMKGETPDVMVSDVLDILQQITSIFPDAAEASSVKDVISVLTQVLRNERLNPVSEEKLIRILCDLCHYSDVRDILLRFLEKLSTSEPLHGDIQKALSSKKRKCKEGFKKVNTKVARIQRRKRKPKKKEKKKKRNSSRQKDVPDVNVKA